MYNTISFIYYCINKKNEKNKKVDFIKINSFHRFIQSYLNLILFKNKLGYFSFTIPLSTRSLWFTMR